MWGILEHFGPILKSRWVLGRQRGSRLPGTLEPGQLLPITLSLEIELADSVALCTQRFCGCSGLPTRLFDMMQACLEKEGADSSDR